MNFKGRSFLKLIDFTPEEILRLIDLAAQLKADKKSGKPHDVLHGKNVALIFEKTSFLQAFRRASASAVWKTLQPAKLPMEPASAVVWITHWPQQRSSALPQWIWTIRWAGVNTEKATR